MLQLLLSAQQHGSRAACAWGSGAPLLLLLSSTAPQAAGAVAASPAALLLPATAWPGQALAGSGLGGGPWHLQQQQQRGAAKKTQPTAKGKKGQPAPKKQKQKLESKPFDDKDPLLQKLVAMLVPAAEPLQRSEAVQAELLSRAREFSRRRMQEHKAWKADLNTKLALKKAALLALPPNLRAAAQEEDLADFPLTRHYAYDTPPDAYKE